MSVFGIQGSCECRCLVFRDPDVFGVHVLMVSVFGVMLGPCLVSCSDRVWCPGILTVSVFGVRDPDGVRAWCPGILMVSMFSVQGS